MKYWPTWYDTCSVTLVTVSFYGCKGSPNAAYEMPEPLSTVRGPGGGGTGSPPAASRTGGGQSLARSGRVSDGPLARWLSGPTPPVIAVTSTITSPVTITARAAPPNQRSISRPGRAGSSGGPAGPACAILGGAGASRVTVPARLPGRSPVGCPTGTAGHALKPAALKPAALKPAAPDPA